MASGVKSVVLYVVLVGGSVVPILGLLYYGKTLRAPMAVGGSWTIEAQADALCPGLPIRPDGPAFKIAQSGTYLHVEFNDARGTRLDGRLEDTLVSASGRAASQDEGSLRFEGRVELSSEVERLRGTIALDGCNAPFPLVATREDPAKKGAATH